MSVGGFIPIMDPSVNDTREPAKPKDWPRDEHFKEVPLVTKSETQTRRTSIQSLGHVDKIGTSTISHLTTSISPILSTLLPKAETTTEKPSVEELSEEDDEFVENPEEMEPRNPNKFEKMSFEEELYRQNQEMTESSPKFTSPIYQTSTTTESTTVEDRNEMPSSTTTESEPPVRESVEAFDESNINFNESSSLSADHLIAPDSIISSDVPNKIPSLPAKAGKITKVFSPSPPPPNSNEISKLLSPFYPQQYSSEPPTSFDNEFQPNQIYQQMFNENERISESPQYERDDMEWYYINYNQSHSNPILNYNLQPYDNFERNPATKLHINGVAGAIVLIVIRNLVL